MEKSDFYSSGLGDNLIENSLYPREIILFLEKEKEIVQDMLKNFDLLFEVGCMEGRYLDVALAEHKAYYGIDIVDRYVKNGQKTIFRKNLSASGFTIAKADASSIDDIFSKNDLREAVIIFPFNSFGNMINMTEVAYALAKTKKPFLIFTYKTDAFSNNARLEYYNNCGYKNIICEIEDRGVRFSSEEGLNTVAYNEDFIRSEFNKLGVDVEGVNFSTIGIVYKGFLDLEKNNEKGYDSY